MQWKKSAVAATGLLVAATGLLVGACGQSAVPGVALSATPGVETAAAVSLGTGASELGEIITDGEGMTLYRFDTDSAKPSISTCGGDCAVAWPPLYAEDAGAVAVDGVDQSLLGVVAREDGRTQLTVAGWPAYYYSKDTEPGDVKGQGAGGKWFAFSTTGKKAAGPVGGSDVRLAVMDIAGLGRVMTDREGMTLYRFDKDKSKPSEATCAGDCAAKWPPVLVPDGAEVEVDGLDKADVGVVERADGTRQATVGGWPLYRFAGDEVPCDTNGHGVGGTWFAAAPDGKKAGA